MGALNAAATSRELARILRPFTGLAFRRGQRMVLRLLSWMLNVLLFVSVALVTGLGSAWYSVDIGLPLTVESYGPWRSWVSLGHPSADPYSRDHAIRAGILPLSSTTARYFVATHDSDGRRLYGDCEYELVGRGPPAAWWSLAVYDREGSLIPNPSGRYSINTGGLMRSPSGQFTVRLAKDARAGNWLPVSGSEAIVLVIRAYIPDLPQKSAEGTQGSGGLAAAMPTIGRIECR